MQSALVALTPTTGRVRALVGGFDFSTQQFNHVTQGWRQPGSSFKPFLYSAAIDQGVMPSTVVNDGPLDLPGVDGGPGWNPQNDDGQFLGAIPLRTALARSRNLVSVRLVQMLGVDPARTWAARFGFDIDKQPANLTLALGAGSTTPLQLASAYGVFANGGHVLPPVVIERITDAQGKVLFEAAPPPVLADLAPAVPERNLFITNSMLQTVTSSGTAARAQGTLKRPDLYGKTGTTNDSLDAWFAGFQPTMTAVAWMGYDTPRKLGDRETGGGLSLPIWIAYMETALKGVPVAEMTAPQGVVQVGNEWYFDDFAPGRGVASLGIDTAPVQPAEASAGGSVGAPPAAEERNRILDLFRN